MKTNSLFVGSAGLVSIPLIENNGRLDAGLVSHRIQRIPKRFQLEYLVNDTSHIDLAALEALDATSNAPHLRE
jgi:hypothetical protein